MKCLTSRLSTPHSRSPLHLSLRLFSLGILIAGAGCLANPAMAADAIVDVIQPDQDVFVNTTPAQQRVPTAVIKQTGKQNKLPNAITNRLRKDLSKQTGIAPGKLKLVSATPKTWSDGCLGLGRPEESCLQALVEGWQVVFSNGQQRWVYHTNAAGDSYRLAPTKPTATQPESQLPAAARTAVLKQAAQATGVPIARLRIVSAEQITTDACLGLAPPGVMCAQIAVDAWEVTVRAGDQRLVYRVRDDASQVKRADTIERESSQNPGKPSRIPANEMPPELRAGTLFRAISSGGFAGRTYQTTLLNDGRLIRLEILPNNRPAEPQVRQIPWSEVRQFQRLLAKESLKSFDRLSYPAVPGSADYFTVTLSSRSGTVRYADTIQSELPTSLQTVIKAWNQLITP